MIARRSRSILTRLKGSLEKTALPILTTNFSTTARQHQTASPENDPSQGPDARLPLSLQAIYYQPLRRKPTLGLPVCDIQFRSYSVRNLEFMCDFALRAAYYCNLPAAGPVPLPKKTERWTVPRGHFIHKKSQENYERVTHKRLIQIKDGHPETVELWLAFLRKHQYYGVGMKANVWGFDELGVGKRMNVSLETLKDVPRPGWVHFGSRRTFETAEKVREILSSEGYQSLDAEPAQVDAALKQVVDDEAVQAKVREILESPRYKALLEEDAAPLEAVQETVEPVEAAAETLPEEALATPGDAVPEAFEITPEQAQAEVIPKDEILAEAPEATSEQALAEAVPKDEILAEASETTPEAAPTPEAALVEAETLSSSPAEPTEPILEQTPIEAIPEDSVLAQTSIEEVTPTQTPTETEPSLEATSDSIPTQPSEASTDTVPETFSTTPETPIETASAPTTPPVEPTEPSTEPPILTQTSEPTPSEEPVPLSEAAESAPTAETEPTPVEEPVEVKDQVEEVETLVESTDEPTDEGKKA